MKRDYSGQILTVKEVASYLSCDKGTIYRLLKKRAIPAFKIGSDWRFSRDALEKWIRDQPQGNYGRQGE